ncbi:MAG: CRTAC1 family protein [Bacteroidota bacterium]
MSRSQLFQIAILLLFISFTSCFQNKHKSEVVTEILEPVFTRIDTGTLVNEVVRGRGLYPVDIDQDYDLDLYIGNSTGAYFKSVGSGKNRPNLLYRNEGNCRFTKVTEGILAQTIYETNHGNNWGDFDNDGDWDLFNQGNLFVNAGDGSTEDVIRISERGWMVATWADYNSDSYLDIFANVFFDGNYMYKNNGDGTFTEISAGAATKEGIGGSQSSAWADFDNDGDLDVLEANLCFFGSCDSLLPNKLYINQGDGTFSSLDNGTPLVSDAIGAGGAAWGDYDNDGDMDVYVTSVLDSINVLYKNLGNMEFERIIIEPEEARRKFTYNSTWGDFNNDGNLDLFVGVVSTRDSAFGNELAFRENLLFMNRGNGTFSRITDGSIIADGAQATVANDIDNDGDLDLIITHGNLAPPFLTYIYRNEGNRNHWLNFTCEGTISNRSGIGTRIRLKANIHGKEVWMTRELTQENGIHACNGARMHFGLGNAQVADSLVIRWPLGHMDTYVDVPVNHFYKIIENTDLEVIK